LYRCFRATGHEQKERQRNPALAAAPLARNRSPFCRQRFLSYPEMLIHASATDRGMIKAFLTGLWLMSFLAVRFPLKMLPIFFFKSTPDGRSFR